MGVVGKRNVRMIETAGRILDRVLDLKGGMMDFEALMQNVFQTGEERIVGIEFGNDEMGGEGGFGGTHGPDMQIVEIDDARRMAEEGDNPFAVDMGGDGIKGQVGGIAKQAPGSDPDDQTDHEADERVELNPTSQGDGEGGEENAGGDSGIGGHMDECAADIEIVAAAAVEEERGDPVNDDTGAGDTHHEGCGDELRLKETMGRLPGDGAEGGTDQERVEPGGEDGRPAPTIGPGGGGSATGQHRSRPGEDEAEHIDEVVAGIREQGQRVGLDSREDLNQYKSDIERNSNPEGGFKLAGGRGMFTRLVHTGHFTPNPWGDNPKHAGRIPLRQ
jgi:hypothetical protein